MLNWKPELQELKHILRQKKKVKRCCRQTRPGHVLGTMTKWPAEKKHSQHNKMHQIVETAKPPNHRSPQGGGNPFFSIPPFPVISVHTCDMHITHTKNVLFLACRSRQASIVLER